MKFIFVSEKIPCAVGINGKRAQYKTRKYGRWIICMVLWLAAKRVR